MSVRTASRGSWSGGWLAGSRAREIRVPRRQAQQPRPQLMEAGHEVATGRCQLAPVLTRAAELGGHERAGEGLLSPLDAAPDMPVAPAHVVGRMLDGAGPL